MLEKMMINEEDLEKVSGGTGGSNTLDPSYSHLITLSEIPTVAIGTSVLVSYSSGTQLLGPLVSAEKITSSDRSWVIGVNVQRASSDAQSYLGGTTHANFVHVNVYRK